jgi:hypothetical protein
MRGSDVTAVNKNFFDCVHGVLSVAANPTNKPAPLWSRFNVATFDQQHVLMAQVLKKSIAFAFLHGIKVAEKTGSARSFYLFFIA